MLRYGLPILLVALLAWGIAAIVTGSPGLDLSGSTSSSTSAAASPPCLPATTSHSAALPGTTVDVSPAPNTGTANPKTQISFLGAPASEISAVAVAGSLSGAHPGRLSAYSQGDGASFLPAAPFVAGDRVTVTATIGPGAGVPSRQVRFSFDVDTPYPTASVAPFPNPPAAPADYLSFATLPGAQIPVMAVTVHDADPAAGDIMTTNGPGPGQYGPIIYSPSGQPIWFDRLPSSETAENLDEQTLGGRPVLTWWRGKVLSLGFGQGEDLVMNSRYQVVARLPGANGLRADLHDFQLAPRGVAYITAFNPIRCDLAPAGGVRDGAIVDTAVQEIDLATGLVRWEWHSLDHVAVSESETPAPTTSTPWDWFHVNSIDFEGAGSSPSGDLFISARNTWAAYQLAAGSGLILWRLGGTRSSFRMGPGTATAWQHDGRVLASGDEITLFDDGSNPPIHSQSRGLVIALDFAHHTARLLRAYPHPGPPVLAASQGNMQTLPSGAALVGFGAVPQITEFAPAAGTVLFDAHLPYDMTFYRAYRHPWSGRPASPPALLANLNNTAEETIFHMSWNGATGVTAWRLFAGSSPGSLEPLATVTASGFETTSILPKRYAYAAAQPLDSAGRVPATSKAVKVSSYNSSLPSDGTGEGGSAASGGAGG
ncbi:MAG TPA: arylsulfotransferase family protein [Solirubrobacteraceae bacterium]|nr:arylsulfotransferase family protein [Solirubrobacteraceae bacterium]